MKDIAFHGLLASVRLEGAHHWKVQPVNQLKLSAFFPIDPASRLHVARRRLAHRLTLVRGTNPCAGDGTRAALGDEVSFRTSVTVASAAGDQLLVTSPITLATAAAVSRTAAIGFGGSRPARCGSAPIGRSRQLTPDKPHLLSELRGNLRGCLVTSMFEVTGRPSFDHPCLKPRIAV